MGINGGVIARSPTYFCRATKQSLRDKGHRLLRFLWSLAMTFFILSLCGIVFAEVSIETSVSRSRLAVGEELTLDIIITNANGDIEKPVLSSVSGFSSYSQGHSQEITIINGRATSRSIFSYVLIANSVGKQTIGPFDVNIGGRTYKVASVEVEVTPDTGFSQAPSQAPVYSQGPAVSPPSRALPRGEVTNQDIFVKAWLDKDEVYVNEPAILTYTIYTRLSATYKGFEKEPATTGFWVEDFPPEKTTRKTEQSFNGTRYVVADVRKLALFPTQAGVFTIDPGTVATTVEIRDTEDFDSFFSYNIFGRRSPAFAPSFMTQMLNKAISADPVKLVVKALPETGKPASFTGAVGDYRIESSIDKSEVEEGNPVTYRVRVIGQGNINTVQTPSLPPMDNFKIYDSSSSANISKDHLVVEGDKVTETVLVPKKAGRYTIPALSFSYFDPEGQVYKEIKTSPHVLSVKPGAQTEEPAETGGVQPVEKEEVSLMGQDIRYIKTGDAMGAPASNDLYKNPFFWLVNVLLVILSAAFLWLANRRASGLKDARGARLRRSHGVARRKLRNAASLLKKDKPDEFYAEIDRAVYGYFADKLNVSSQGVTVETIEQGVAEDALEPALMSEIRSLFDELARGRFASIEKDREHMQRVYQMADQAITRFEKVKLK